MKALLYIVAAVAAFGQAQTPLKVHQGGATAGQLWLQEPRAGGTDWLKLRAGTLAADVTFTLPTADGTANQCLSTDGAGQWGWRTCSGASIDLLTTDYDWYQTPGVSLTAATPATVTLTPCPAGVAPYIAHYSTRIAGGVGAAETVLITAVSGSGATCDITFTPANNHTGSWTIGSASDGIQEAVNYSIANVGHRVFIPQGVSTPDPVAPGEESTIYVQGPVTIAGANQSINGGSEIALNHNGQWAIIVTTGATNWPVHFEKFAIQGTGLTTGGGVKITASTTHNCFTKLKDMQLYSLPVGAWFYKACGQEISGNLFYGFTDAGLRIENAYDTDAGDQTITNNIFLVIGASTATALDWLSAGGARIIGNKFNVQGAAINMTLSDPSIIAIIQGNSFDNQTLFSVKLRSAPGAMGNPVGFLGAVIANNVVTGAGASGYIAFDIGDNTTDYLSNVSVTGNTMQSGGMAIKVGDAQNVSIASNVIGEFTTGIQVKATATGFSHGKNTIYNVTTPYDIDAAAGVRPTSPLFASGYGGWAASGTNIKAIAEFAPPASGEVNNAILFQTNTTGTNSQRGIWWDTVAGMHFARFSSDRATTHTTDLKLEADGDAHFSYKLGVGRSPVTELDVNGVSRVYDGTIDLRFQVGSGAAYIGTNSNHPLLFTQDAAVRLYLSNSALLPNPSAGDTFNIGDPTIRFLATYSKIVDTVAVGGTGDYMQTRKLQLFDNTGSSTGASYWDLNVVMSGVGAGQNSYFYLRDNGGNTVWRADKIASGSAVATTTIYTDLLPDSTANVRKLGKTGQRWDEINGASMDLSGAANITGNLSAAVINATGSPAYRVSGTTVIDASRNLSNIGTGGFTGLITAGAGVDFGASSTFAADATYDFGTSSSKLRRLYATGWTIYGSSFAASGSAITLQSGSTFTDGRTCALNDVWTSDASGNLACAAPSAGGGWTVSGSDVYRSTGIVTVGHTSPTVRLGQNFNVNYSADYAGMAINTWSAADGHGSVFDFNKSGSSTIGTHGTVANNETLGFFVFRGSDGTAFQRAVEFNAEVDATVSSGVVPGRIKIRTANTSGVMTERLRIASDGLASFYAGVDVTGNLSAAVINATGSPAYRVSGTTVINASRDATFVGLTTSGAVSMASSTIVASSTFSSDLIATSGSTYALGSNAVRWLAYLNSTNINGTVTLNGTITGDILPTSNNTYVNGSSTAYWNQTASETFYVENSGRIRPRTTNTGSVGISSARFNKGWFTDLDITGTIVPPSGTAFSGTKTVRDAAGTGTCTLTFSSGIMTGGTC